MNLDVTLFYIAIFTAVALILLLVGIVAWYLTLLRKYVALKEKFTDFNSERNKELQKIFDDANKNANKIIEEANLKAQEIIKNANTISQDQSTSLQNALEQSLNTYAKSYQETMQSAQNEVNKMVQNISSDMGKLATQSQTLLQQGISVHLDSFALSLQNEITKYQENAKLTMDNAYKALEQELAKYKERRYKDVESVIVDIVEDVSRKVLSKEISMSEHEKLVIKSLEEAKRQGVI